MSRRGSIRQARRPGLESLEVRCLLTVGVDPLPLDVSTVLPVGSSYSGAQNGFDTLIGASVARSENKVDGTGFAVAVIDAGVNYKHPALGGGYGAGDKVVGGYDFAGKDNDPLAAGLQHGTAVAGLIASGDSAYPGVAPGADIVALRVFDDSDRSDFRQVADSLEWVVENHEQFNITVVNVSLSDGRNYTRNWFANDGDVGQRITKLVSQLEDLKIPVVTATGNSFAGQQGSGFTGIISRSISVTASDGSDQLVSNAQRLGLQAGGESATDIAAPGVGLYAPGGGTGFGPVAGTSFAASLVSGSIVLLQQVYQHRFNALPSVTEIESWLKKGSSPVSDPATGISIGRLDLPKAIAQIPTPAAQVLVPPPTTPAPPVIVTPPPVVVTPPPVVVTPPPVVVTPTAPAEPTPEPTTTVQVWLNGKHIDASDQGIGGGGSTFASRVLRSLRDWWWAPNARVKVWGTMGATGEALTAGHATSVAVSRQAEPSAPITRPWQAFVNSRRSG